MAVDLPWFRDARLKVLHCEVAPIVSGSLGDRMPGS
jgi:hypothetical protein